MHRSLCTDPKKLDQKSNDLEVGIFMAKYSFEFKKKVTNAYLAREGGRSYIAKKFGIPNSQMVIQWVNNYKAYGDDGLLRSRKNEKYSFEFKLRIVELYLSSEVSYQELAIQEGIHNPTLICKWVNEFQIAGVDALRPHKKGRKRTLNISNKDGKEKTTETTIVNTSAKHVQELEDELLKLRIENAFLKELRRLRLEDEARTRDWLESSTASEDNSN